MKLTKLIPVLYTNELEETINFYTQNFGFKLEVVDLDLGWATITLNEIEITLSKPIAHLAFTKAIFTGSFYFKTEEVNSIWNEIKNKIEICYPIEDFEYGMREFAVYDNNRYVLQFGQEITKASI